LVARYILICMVLDRIYCIELKYSELSYGKTLDLTNLHYTTVFRRLPLVPVLRQTNPAHPLHLALSLAQLTLILILF
jgi:hypothetical protein